MKHIDKFGNIVSGIGLALTTTVVGAEVGIPLMEIGGYISLGAKGMTTLSYLYEGKSSRFLIEGTKMAIEELITRGTGKLIKPVGRGINQKLGEEINGRIASEAVIPMVEQQIKTVN